MQDALIRRVPRFATLPAHLMQIVAAACEQRRYAAGDMILVQGTIPAGLYILLHGQAVWLQTGLDGRVSQLGAMLVGQHIHDEALFDDRTMDTASLQAVNTTTMLVLSRKSMTSLLAKYPELQAALGIKPSPAAMPAPKITPAKQKATKTEAELVDVGMFSPFSSVLTSASGATIFRYHWTSWLSRIFLPIFLIGAALLTMISLILGNPLAEFAAYAWAGSGGLLIFSLLWFFNMDWHWHNDFILLNASHLSLVERHTFFRPNSIESIPLQHIQEVKLLKPSLLQQILGFGDLELSFFGKDEAVYLESMAAPTVLKSEIERRQQEMVRRGANEAEQREQEVLKQLRRYSNEIMPNVQAPSPYETREEAPRPSPFGQPRPKTGEILPPEPTVPPNPVMPNKVGSNRPPKFPQKRQS